MSKPFPSPLNIGTDICHIPRIYNLLYSKPTTSKPTRFLQKVLLSQEITSNILVSDFLIAHASAPTLPNTPAASNSSSKESPEKSRKSTATEIKSDLQQDHSSKWELARFIAGRWAAKEAVIKAHSRRRLTMRDIWIQKGDVDARGLRMGPRVVVRALGEDGSMEGWERGREVRVSISHDGEYATAVCLAVDEVEDEWKRGEE